MNDIWNKKGKREKENKKILGKWKYPSAFQYRTHIPPQIGIAHLQSIHTDGSDWLNARTGYHQD